MNEIPHSERATQNRVLALLQDELGYRFLGDWTDRAGNSCVEDAHLTSWLKKRGYKSAQINKALRDLRNEAGNPNRSLYDNNKAVYSLLRYGVPVKIEAGKVTETVKPRHCRQGLCASGETRNCRKDGPRTLRQLWLEPHHVIVR